jgi:hypothetical protein
VSRKTSRKQSEQMDDFTSNLRGFRSNQSIRNMNNIDMDLFIESFDRRNWKTDEKLRGVNWC